MGKELMKGFVNILILLILTKKDSYGYEISKYIKDKSNEKYILKDGTLYPALKRLELKGLINSYWEEVDYVRKRKYYKISDLGKNFLDENLEIIKDIINLLNNFQEGLK
ncbi:PadR family transcriptional regulator [Clostridium botulinum C]|uniref:PadR family transcriptional regulator n=1 Tax=Clostridium botulinum TaxID=1491 RepID=UPI001E3B10D9|nr:PadR family transcriptional regulator [Clostridium botulinum]MCD3206752.1 PadR family transcriptional regulator [Clostridium botulinum C]MCD3209663.1 PadR family transcriptional regulator [Clostridium botulinum C]MCD3226552.1 PadR family transcriptional regulator [Clostridium botulinum C]MCD3248986.1 PadR family transcriptional regulator [Clostridium botulinum C]MCD3257570.1 PadR family transcriptional regulator [Clostridium botulinum C]